MLTTEKYKDKLIEKLKEEKDERGVEERKKDQEE